MKTSERLLVKLRKAGLDIPEGAVLKSLRPSRSQRNVGAWSWAVCTADGHPMYKGSQGQPLAIGSQFRMAELLAHGFEVGSDRYGDINIDLPLAVLQRKAGR